MMRRWTLVVVGLFLSGAFAGSVVAAQQIWFSGPDQIAAALDRGALVKVADISALNGLAGRGVYVQQTPNGLTCLWDAPSFDAREKQGGCNSADDPLAGSKMMISFAYEGGPALETVSDARLIGLISDQVGSVQVVMSDGTRRRVPVHRTPRTVGEFQAFGARFGRAEIRRGLTPVAVIALDRTGAVIDRQETGFGS
jgi:hypothetical protein